MHSISDVHLSWANCTCYQLNWNPWQCAHLNHEGQSSTEKYVQLKRSPKYRWGNAWNCFFQNIFKCKYAHRHCKVKIRSQSYKRNIHSKVLSFWCCLLSKKLQTKITSHRYAHFVLHYAFLFTPICFNNYALFWHFESFPWHSAYYLIRVTSCHWKCAVHWSWIWGDKQLSFFFLPINFSFMKTSFLTAWSSWQQIAAVNIWQIFEFSHGL